jgi:hypothetical protein
MVNPVGAMIVCCGDNDVEGKVAEGNEVEGNVVKECGLDTDMNAKNWDVRN